jgi:hypothetical protein
MALKKIYENAEEIPAEAASMYSKNEDTGHHHLSVEVEGMVDKARLDDFRDNNIQLRKDVEAQQDLARTSEESTQAMAAKMKELENKFSGIDLEEWATLQAEKKAVADKELIEAGEVDTLVNRRVEEVASAKQREIDALTKTYESRISELNGDIKGFDSQLSEMLIDNEITKIAADAGVRSSAMEDVLLRGRGVFRVKDGKAIAFDTEGRNVYGDDAVTPLSINAWMGKLTENAPHLFDSSTGAQVQQPATTRVEASSKIQGVDSILAGLSKLK